MTIQDVTRVIHAPAKHYSGLRLQQGRQLLDDTWNENESIADEALRHTRVDALGASGSPNDGFRIDDVQVAGGKVDFRIGAGHFYLGGLRLELESAERLRSQQDWLRRPADLCDAPAGARQDLVLLLAWQQAVTEAEDRELAEPALGGADVATRVRTMRRVLVVEGVAADNCCEAWQTVVAALADASAVGLPSALDGVRGTLAADHGLDPDLGLGVTFTAGTAGDLCSPAVAGGYLHAENQALRVQLIDDSTLTWGRDNASPLYRVTVGADDKTLTLETVPRDVCHWPLLGQTVEVLAHAAQLSNGERLADAQGVLRRVASAYDPDEGTVVLDSVLPANFGAVGGIAPTHLYLRVWDRADDLASPAAIAHTTGTPVALGTTGFAVTVTGTHRNAGAHWVIGARPAVPDHVLPWTLETQAPPHGTRYYVAPLALLEWDALGAIEEVNDCRARIQPLTRMRGCCTLVVGDGRCSHGDYDSIAAALEDLPKEGGKLCLLPGVYEEAVTIERDNVTLSGCGSRSVLRLAATHKNPTDTVLTLAADKVTVEHLRVEALEGFAITSELNVAHESVTLRGLEVEARDRSAVLLWDCDEVRISDCAFKASVLAAAMAPGGDKGLWAAVLVQGKDIRVERCRIEGERNKNRLLMGLGGLQVGGGSKRVRLRDNHIEAGNGNGITLGHVVYVPGQSASAGSAAAGEAAANALIEAGAAAVWVDAQGCLHVTLDPPTSVDPEDPDPPVAISGGDLADVRIEGNEVAGMGANGISVARFFDPKSKWGGVIAVDDLFLLDNRVRGCLEITPADVSPSIAPYAAVGGITLGAGERTVVRANRIERNGAAHGYPVCGLFVLDAEGIVVESNRILDNGRVSSEETALQLGRRGGIYLANISESLAPQLAVLDADPAGSAAATVANNVVSQPFGRALTIVGFGRMTVHGNQLRSGNVGFVGLLETLFGALAAGEDLGELFLNTQDLLAGNAVALVNLGLPNEFLTTSEAELRRRAAGVSPLLGRGSVMFNDNQVLLDMLDARFSLGLCSVFALTLDDMSFDANQCEVAMGFDYMLANVVAMATTLRARGNRLQESLLRAQVSAYAYAIALNTTTDNQSTHCIDARCVVSRLLVAERNRAVVQAFSPLACGSCVDIGADAPEPVVTVYGEHGELLPSVTATVAGTTGVLVTHRAEMTLPGPAAEVKLGLYRITGSGTIQLQAFSAGNAPVDTQDVDPAVGASQAVTLAGSGIERVAISVPAEGQVLLTRACGFAVGSGKRPDASAAHWNTISLGSMGFHG